MKHYHLLRVSSTNDYAKELLETESPVAVTADFQWEGRGRNNNSWEGNYGENIYCSVGINHKDGPPPLETLVLYQAIGCLAAKYALTEVTEKDIFYLKYPNDVLVKDKNKHSRKICGVLNEHGFIGSECIYSIIGIGINILQKDFGNLNDIAVSLVQLGFHKSPREIITILLKHIENLLNFPTDDLFNIWKRELDIIGKTIVIIGGNGTWKVEQLGRDGRLTVNNEDTGEQRYIDDGSSIRII